MPKRKIMIWIGVLIALMPFLGFPPSWKTAFYFVSGVLIAWNSYQLNKHRMTRRQRREQKPKESIPAHLPPEADSSITTAETTAEVSGLKIEEKKEDIKSPNLSA